MPALRDDSYEPLVGKFVATQRGQMLVERIEWAPMLASGRLLDGEPVQVELETILDSEVTEVDWRDPEVIEKWLQGEPIVDDVKLDTPPPASPVACACKCGHKGGCYRLAVRDRVLAGHQKVSAYGCNCEARRCICVEVTPRER